MPGPRFALMLATLLLAPILTSPSYAEDYPARPVKIIVPFGAGGKPPSRRPTVTRC
jgi:tripartite-type tricarboxylate transporter receptor subunit TctC